MHAIPTGLALGVSSTAAIGVALFVLVAGICFVFIHRIVRNVRRGRRVVAGLYLSLRQANRRVTQLALMSYATTLFPVFALIPRESVKKHILALTVYLITVALAVVWLSIMAVCDLREIRRASRGVFEETARDIADELDRGDRDAKNN